ncbi:hypothetical protein T484DRAFT_1764382 [Baffinella frigidus]|nr:hypothetical protein T484DRAFT_1764382 [Cryptophyta sp. CCMP2293]
MSEESEKAFLAGNEEFVNQNWSVALDHFNRALELEPGRVEFLLHKAAALTKMGSLAEAVTTCETAIEKEPHNAKAYLRLGMALVQKGDLAAARKVLEHGQELDPKNKSFAPQIKKCGDAGLEAGPVAGNLERGKHDAALEAMLEAHGQQGYALLDTTMHFLQRKTPFFNMAPPIPADMIKRKTPFFNMPPPIPVDTIKVLASHYSSAGSAASGAAPSGVER